MKSRKEMMVENRMLKDRIDMIDAKIDFVMQQKASIESKYNTLIGMLKHCNNFNPDEALAIMGESKERSIRTEW